MPLAPGCCPRCAPSMILPIPFQEALVVEIRHEHPEGIVSLRLIDPIPSSKAKRVSMTCRSRRLSSSWRDLGSFASRSAAIK